MTINCSDQSESGQAVRKDTPKNWDQDFTISNHLFVLPMTYLCVRSFNEHGSIKISSWFVLYKYVNVSELAFGIQHNFIDSNLINLVLVFMSDPIDLNVIYLYYYFSLLYEFVVGRGYSPFCIFSAIFPSYFLCKFEIQYIY